MLMLLMKFNITKLFRETPIDFSAEIWDNIRVVRDNGFHKV